jgi:hypothetical protein
MTAPAVPLTCMRKIHMIAGAGANLFALCTDGTVWQTSAKAKMPTWRILPNVPQDPPKKLERRTAPEDDAFLVSRAGVVSKTYLDARNNAWTENPDRATVYPAEEAEAIATDIRAEITPRVKAIEDWEKIITGPASRAKKKKQPTV